MDVKLFARLAVFLSIGGAQVDASPPASGKWVSPFQAGQPSAAKLQPLARSSCNHAAGNKCTFAAPVDYNQDGKLDRAQMVEGAGVSAIVVHFGTYGKKLPLTVASFKGKWSGDCYIEPTQPRRVAITLICPEISSAVFEMRGRKPVARWMAD